MSYHDCLASAVDLSVESWRDRMAAMQSQVVILQMAMRFLIFVGLESSKKEKEYSRK